MINVNQFYSDSIEKTLSESLTDKIVFHRSRFKRLFKARYMEMLPSLIKYKNFESVSVDFLKVEVALRNGYDVVIGKTNRNHIQVIGYANSKLTVNDPSDLFSERTLRHGDIHFVIPLHLREKYYKEISDYDGARSGNFVVLRNKTLNYQSDISILDHYIDELAEIVLSRYSISMQVKISTLFLGEPGDESMNQLITSIYNGNPYIEGSKLFDPDEQIYHMQNEGIAQNFQELKREYQNKISELNNMLGLNSLAVEKSSGVSDTEADSNRAYTTSNANIYLDARNHGLRLLNKRYGLDIETMYNDDVRSEIQELNIQEGGEGNENNQSVQSDTLGNDE